ncbi:MAG: deoxyribodipyrimidine photo-lyase, partial [bacterium]|nr:deoxyribodipyrimidine photo-lyase [bacterium]
MAAALHIFRRDLRVDDNTALCAAAAHGARVLPCFIFDPRQVQDNPYRSDNAVQFLVASLRDLDVQRRARGGRLFLLHGKAEEVVARLLTELDISAVHVNADYTPFSKQRDAAIADACARHGVTFHSSHDALLHAPDEVLTASGTPYTVFTPYLRRALKLPPRAPRTCPDVQFHIAPVAWADKDFTAARCAPDNPHIRVRGGRAEALRILKSLASFSDYAAQRDIPAQPTTGLSAHIKFGTVSIREVYAAVMRAHGPAHVLINELHWHDFFTQVGHFFPHVFGHAFR